MATTQDYSKFSFPNNKSIISHLRTKLDSWLGNSLVTKMVKPLILSFFDFLVQYVFPQLEQLIVSYIQSKFDELLKMNPTLKSGKE